MENLCEPTSQQYEMWSYCTLLWTSIQHATLALDAGGKFSLAQDTAVTSSAGCK